MKHFTYLKRWALMVSVLFVGVSAANAQCTWTLNGFDSFGDGWNGGSLAITDNGVPVAGSPFAVAASSDTWTFTVTDGNTIELTWTAGSFLSEVSFNLQDDTGATVFNQPSPAPSGTSVVYSGTIVCTPCGGMVSNLNATGFTPSTADLSWDPLFGATSYDVEWGLVGFTPGTGTEVGAATTGGTMTTASGLLQNTDYEFYVQSDCGNGWSGPFAFAIPCILTTPAVLAWVEDFEGVTAATQIGDGEMHCAPTYKWDFATNDQTAGRVRFGSNAIIAQSGSGAATLDRDNSSGTSTAQLILTIDLSNYTATPELAMSFDWMHHGEEDNAGDRVWIRGSDVDPWIEVFDFTPITSFSNAGEWINEPLVDLITPLTGAGQVPSATFQVRFGQEDNFPATSTTASDGLTIDNVALFTCLPPTNLAIEASDTTSASFSWLSSASEWQIEYGPAGFTPGSGTSFFTTQNPDTITGLTPYTFYDVYVQSICGPGDTSTWIGPLVFNTYDQGLYMEGDSECSPLGFVDIAATGVLNTLGDDGEVTATLPFPLLYQGNLVNDITIGSNGAIVMGGGLQVGFSNGTMASAIDGLYPYWDDLGPEETGEGVFFETIGTAPNQVFIVQWNKDHLSGNGDTYIFQLQIDEATNEVYFVYDVVDVNDPSFDYGNSATIGVAGPNQDIQMSINNPQYLTDESCAHFYYTDCPKPQNYSVTYTTTTEAAITWSAGLSNETNWTVIYGLEGFDPTQEGITVQTTGTALVIAGLDDATIYDVYIYADCDTNLQSVGIMGQFATLPFCADPTGFAGATSPDSIFTSWSWTMNAGYPISEFAMEYGLTGFNNGAGNYVWGVDTTSYLDTIADAGLIGGALYDVYIQAICNTDSSYWVGPITVTMPLSNDSTCLAEELAVDGTVYTLDGAGATAATGESAIAPAAGTCTGNMTWCNSSITASTWFTFTAPASGNVRIDGEAAGFNGQIAVYESTDCSNFNSFTLLGANDDDPQGGNHPFLNICGLTPGNTYYLMHDPFTTTGIYSLRLQDVVVEAGTDNGLLNICLGDTVNLNTQLSGADAGGMWVEAIPTAGFNDPVWNSAGLASQVFTFEYFVIDGCAVDSVETQVEVYAPSYAGLDGGLTACLNEPITLNDGLSGNGVDLGGTWYDPSNNVTSPNINSGQVPGQFNYDYIAGNGVCEDDTANIILTVDATCNFLDLTETAFEGMDIYPNPTTNVFYITNEGSSEVYSYELTDLNGKIITSKEAAINGTQETEVSVENLETGVYLIKIFNENSEKVFRVVKQ